MNWLAAHWLQLAMVIVYLMILAHHARVGQQRVHTLDDYLVAGRGLGGCIIALSFYATFMSTNTFIGAAGKSWDVGLIWCIGGVVLVACCCASWFFVAPRFVPLTKQYGSLTVADFLGHRYKSMRLRKMSAGIIVFASIVYLMAIYRGSALAVDGLLQIPYPWAVMLIFVVVTAYTLAGGFESVVLTDAVQGMLMVVGAVAMIAAVIYQGGGLLPILENLRSQDPKLVSWQGKMPWSEIIALQLAVGIKYLVEPRQLSRFYGLKDASAVRVGAIVAPLLILVTYICLLPIGALARAVIPSGEISSTDEVVPHLLGIANIFGPVLSTMFLLVLLSAAMSSIDSVLLVAAASIDHDLISPDVGGDKAVNRTRVWVVVVSLASMLAALTPLADDIVTLTAFSGSLYGACFFPALVIGLYWRKPAEDAAMASLLAGSAVVVAWFAAINYDWVTDYPWTKIHEVWVGLAVGIGVYVLIGLLSSQSRRE
jgi:SSS family transporter